ncbi:MAG: hypothetical protein KC592_06565, partial [Nitrospira sp.]|nr:hypothetical protein [Nitrospira sp.]
MRNNILQQSLMTWALWWSFTLCWAPFTFGEIKTPDTHISQVTQSSTNALTNIALDYAEAMAARKVTEWAELDLACLTRQMKREGSGVSPQNQGIAKDCWQDTLAAHRELVRDEPELGIFGAMGRGAGLGLIHESHRHADFWKDYPPALAISPAILSQSQSDVLPQITVDKAQPARPGGLILVPGQNPVEAQVTTVDLLVTFPNPMVAPLALRPGEPWWTSGVIRRYGPVRTLVVRFFVVSGLQSHGYAVDQAIVNEALPDGPQLAEPGSPGILPDSPRWWDRSQAPQLFEDELHQAQHLES